MPQVENGHYRIVFTNPETFYEKVTQVPKKPFMKMARDGKLSVVAKLILQKLMPHSVHQLSWSTC